MPASATTHDVRGVGMPVTGAGQRRDQRLGLGLNALEQVHIQRESVTAGE
jgi:hypothetical protein